jgi:hypothetical protein
MREATKGKARGERRGAVGTGNFYGKNVLRVYGIPIVSLQEPVSEQVVRHDCRRDRGDT